MKKSKNKIEKEIRTIVAKHKEEKGPLIPVLQDAQDAFGYLPEQALRVISKELKIPLSGIYGVVTFYAQFHLERKGENTLKVCMGTACYVKGAPEIVDAIRRELQLQDDENTTSDYKFTLEIARCLGTCFLGPVIMVNDDYYGNLTPDRIPGVLKLYR